MVVIWVWRDSDFAAPQKRRGGEVSKMSQVDTRRVANVWQFTFNGLRSAQIGLPFSWGMESPGSAERLMTPAALC